MNTQLSKQLLIANGLRCLTAIGLVCSTYLLGAGLTSHAVQGATLADKAVAEDTTIIYVKNSTELHLIQPDGTNDRLIWQIPQGAIGEIESVAWRPDAQQIAFVSSHEATCSEFNSDIYLINPDGSNLRRLTNAPACGELAGYPQGSASVQIANHSAAVSEFLVYVEGAPTAKVVTIAAGGSTLVAFGQVADLGAGVRQGVVVINGTTRWFDAAVTVDVTAGQNSHAGTLTVSGSGFSALGATHASWNPQGNTLVYQLGQGRLWQVGVDVPILGEGGPLLDPAINNSVLGTHPIWSPVDSDILYQRFDTNPFTVSRVTAGSNTPGTALANITLTSGLAWLSDGSGFVAADDDSLFTHTDLYLMTFADQNIVQLTQTATHQAALYPRVSPDSNQILYTYVADTQTKPLAPQLRIMNRDGSNDHLLVANGYQADWSRVAPANPPATPLPTPTVTPLATPPGQPTPISTPVVQPYSAFLPKIVR